MAQNYILLTLDTTAPNVELLMPNYTTSSAKTEIRLASSETLADWQDIYIVDSLGNRRNLTFLHNKESNEYIGTVIFEGYPVGLATVYARLMDEVGNKTDIISKSIKVIQAERLNVAVSSFKINEVSTGIDEKNAVKVDSTVSYGVNVKTSNSYNISTMHNESNIVTTNQEEVK